MAITEDTKRRLLAFKDKMIVADWMEKQIDADRIMHYKSMLELRSTIAHLIDKDTDAVGESSIRTIAKDIGVELRCTETGLSVLSVAARVKQLEEQLAQAAKVVADHELRIAELERLFITGDQVIVPESAVNGVVGQDRANAHRTGKRA